MADWTTIASLATAGGTLVLAVATYASVRSSNRSARASERSLSAAIRPVLVSSKLQDPFEKVGFMDERWFKVEGGRAIAEATDDAIYLAMSVRNVGPGLAVLDRWHLAIDRVRESDHPPLEEFRRLTRDIYIAPGDIGFWQGAIRETTDPMFAETRRAIAEGLPLTVDVLYADHEGGQRTITRFGLLPAGEAQRLCVVSRHWNLDRSDPR
jgi:hypothetical protein